MSEPTPNSFKAAYSYYDTYCRKTHNVSEAARWARDELGVRMTPGLLGQFIANADSDPDSFLKW